MFTVISGKNANEVWSKALDIVTVSSDAESRAGNTKELLHAAISIEDPINKWVTCRNPPISIAFALAELIWILSESDDASVINYWNPSLHKYAGDYANYPGAYGKRIGYTYNMDQLEKIYETLYNHPESRQAVLLIWNPSTDLPQNKGVPNNDDIPCNICSMIKVRNECLEWTQIMRSNDLSIGFPYDVVTFTSLQEILASWLDVKVGSYNHISDSLHIYESELTTINYTDVEFINIESLAISKDDYKKVIGDIYNFMCEISHKEDLTIGELIRISDFDTGYRSYNNILKVLCAYAANKRKSIDAAERMIKSCTNSAYVSMWNNWKKALGGKNNG